MTTAETNTDRKVPSEYVEAANSFLALGVLSTKLARVYRAPKMPDGQLESDVEHTYHLALTAPELAAAFYPDLDEGLVSQFANVHELAESITGDVWTFAISDEDRKIKEENEKKAVEYLITVLPAHTAELLRRYEQQIEPEARFVRLIDKLVPIIINIIGKSQSTFKEDHNVHDLTTLQKHRSAQTERLQNMFPEFPSILEIRHVLGYAMERELFTT